MRQEDALLVIVDWLRYRRPSNADRLPFFGYDLYIPTLIHLYLRDSNTDSHKLQKRVDPLSNRIEEDRLVDEMFPLFADAAWELCRRGIIRPAEASGIFQKRSITGSTSLLPTCLTRCLFSYHRQ